jgi:hypothetical protein
MWQPHYAHYQLRMREIEAQVDRRRRWQLEDAGNGRPIGSDRSPNPARAGAARVAAGISRAAARFALRLDRRVTVESSRKRMLPDA